MNNENDLPAASRRTARWTRAVVACAFGLGSLCASAPVFAEPLRVVATVPTLAALAQEVAGPYAEVTALASPRQDPHFVDARPDFVLRLNRAHLVVVQGLDLEAGWLPALLLQARNAQVLRGAAGHFDASRSVTAMQVPRAAADRSQGDVHAGGNPHYLYDPRNGALVATALGSALGRLDPAHAAAFQANAQALAARLGEFATVQAARFGQLPTDRRAVITYHDSWPYLLRWLGLHQVATLEPRPGIAPDPAHVAGVLRTAKADAVRALLQEEYYPAATARTVADLAKARLVVAAGGVRFDTHQTYAKWLQGLTDDLHGALKP